MNAITRIQAKDLINGIIKNSWNSHLSIISPTPQFLHYQFTVDSPTLAGNAFHGRITVKTTNTVQSSFASGPGQRLFDVMGVVFLQIFCPISVGQSGYHGEMLADAIKEDLRKQANNTDVWFQDTSVLELTPEELFYRFNVRSRFEYTELS